MENLPYLTAALLCDKVLEEKNGTLSVMRIIDRLEFQVADVPEINKPGIKPAIPISGLISIKSGPMVGKAKISLDGVRPSGAKKRLMTYELDLKGGDHGQNIVVNMALGVEEEGLHWFEVLVGETVLTKIPLMIVRKLSKPETTPSS